LNKHIPLSCIPDNCIIQWLHNAGLRGGAAAQHQKGNYQSILLLSFADSRRLAQLVGKDLAELIRYASTTKPNSKGTEDNLLMTTVRELSTVGCYQEPRRRASTKQQAKKRKSEC